MSVKLPISPTHFTDRHDVDVEAGHLVQGVEHDRVLPGQDGDGDGAVGEEEVGLKVEGGKFEIGGGGVTGQGSQVWLFRGQKDKFGPLLNGLASSF